MEGNNDFVIISIAFDCEFVYKKHLQSIRISYNQTLELKMHLSASLTILIVNFVIFAYASVGPLSVRELNEFIRKILGNVQISS